MPHARQFGLIASILHGDLGQEINISPKQEKAFCGIASEQVQRIEEQLIEWDNDHFARIRRLLSPLNRKTFDNTRTQ